MEYTWYSVISPESCSSILWRSWDYKEQAAEALQLTANDLKKMNLIDGIIKEPLGGAHNDVDFAADKLKKVILSEIEKLENNRINYSCQKIGANINFIKGNNICISNHIS